MTPITRSDADYLRELAVMIDRFRALVEIENAAIERRETPALRGLMPEKVTTSDALDALWREFRPRLAGARPEDRDSFVALAERAAALRPLLARNLTLLNAAKVTAANRIEAGVAAWRRSQREGQTSYHDDGRVVPNECGASIHPARLV